MTILEAMKTGRRYRRLHSFLWHEPGKGAFVVEDILADDWEIECEPIEITRETFDEAWHEALKCAGLSHGMVFSPKLYLFLTNKLGL